MNQRPSDYVPLSRLTPPVLLLLTVQRSLSVVFHNAPQDLDGIKDNSSVIVAGSVIQLFCSASGQFTAPHIQWTRNNTTIPQSAQLSHLFAKSRTTANSSLPLTVSTLVISGFSGSDNGTYRCIAQEGSGGRSAVTIASSPLQLTVADSTNDMTVRVIRELSSSNLSSTNGIFNDDRTYVPIGSPSGGAGGSFLRCSAEQPGSSLLDAPSMMWLKDGTQLSGDGVRVLINTTTSIVGTSNRTVSFIRIFNFSQSDAGVYQCVFYDTPSQGGEVITTRPYKVDTGPVTVTAISSTVIVYCPPEPLIIQALAGGEYSLVQWTRMPLSLSSSSNSLVDFNQTLLISTTSTNDSGLYIITLLPANTTVNSTIFASFNVSLDVSDPPYTKMVHDTITAKSGESLHITCTSTGSPPPTITWYHQTVTGNYGPLPLLVSLGQSVQVSNGMCAGWTVSSTITIINTSMFINQGAYLCIGTNSINGKLFSTNSSVFVTIISDNSTSTVMSASTLSVPVNSFLYITIVVSVISAVVISVLVIGIITLIIKLKTSSCKRRGINLNRLRSSAVGMEVTHAEITISPMPPSMEETSGYSRLFQDTPFYRPRRIKGSFATTQSVPALVSRESEALEKSKSTSCFDVQPLPPGPPPRGYEKPIPSSSESVNPRAEDQATVQEVQPSSAALESSLKLPTVPVYTESSLEEEDFVTVHQLMEMNQKRQKVSHHYVEQALSPSARQLLSSGSALDDD